MATRWKAFERDVAKVLGGRRYWANAGELLDCESETVVAQCKEIKNGGLTLNALTGLAEVAEKQGQVKQKAGVVAVRIKRGRGRPRAPMLFVMTEAVWRYMHGDGAASV